MREDILERKEEILKWIEENQSKTFIAKELKCGKGTLERYFEKMDIQYSGNQGSKGFYGSDYIPALIYIQNGKVKNTVLREKLFREEIKEYKCECCGISEWNEKKIQLQLHHKDGDHFNNELSNLEILCPNCHSQTDTYSIQLNNR